MFNRIGNLEVDSYIMEFDIEGPHLNCDMCGRRIQHGEKTIVIGDLRLDELCAEELKVQLGKLV